MEWISGGRRPLGRRRGGPGDEADRGGDGQVDRHGHAGVEGAQEERRDDRGEGTGDDRGHLVAQGDARVPHAGGEHLRHEGRPVGVHEGVEGESQGDRDEDRQCLPRVEQGVGEEAPGAGEQDAHEVGRFAPGDVGETADQGHEDRVDDVCAEQQPEDLGLFDPHLEGQVRDREGDDDDRRQPETDPPAPGQERLGREDRGEAVEHTGRQEVPQRHRGLRPGRPEAAGLLGGVLGDQQHRAAPLPTDGEALDETQEHEDDRSGVPDLAEGRQTSHEERRGTDEDDRHLQQLLASVFVAEVPEHDPAERTGEEADRIGGEGGDHRIERVVSAGEGVGDDMSGILLTSSAGVTPRHPGPIGRRTQEPLSSSPGPVSADGFRARVSAYEDVQRARPAAGRARRHA